MEESLSSRCECNSFGVCVERVGECLEGQEVERERRGDGGVWKFVKNACVNGREKMASKV